MIAVRYFAPGESKRRYIHIMLHSIRGYDDVADIDISVQGTGNACVDDSVNSKHTDQDLRAGGGVHFSYASLHNDSVLAVQFPFMKFHPRDGFDAYVGQRFFQ